MYVWGPITCFHLDWQMLYDNYHSISWRAKLKVRWVLAAYQRFDTLLIILLAVLSQYTGVFLYCVWIYCVCISRISELDTRRLSRVGNTENWLSGETIRSMRLLNIRNESINEKSERQNQAWEIWDIYEMSKTWCDVMAQVRVKDADVSGSAWLLLIYISFIDGES